MLVQRRRDSRAALRLMYKLLKKQGCVPKLLVTDKLRSYTSALRHLRLSCHHEQSMKSPPAVPSFTPEQGLYLAFIYAYTRVLGRPPAEPDLQRHFGVSPPSVHQTVLTLERAELIRTAAWGRAQH
jgi:DNA-binding MarR family transcriptional regulator